MRATLARMEWDKPNPTPAEVQFIHGSWADARARVRSAMLKAGVPRQRVERFDACGSLAYVERNKADGRLRVRCTRCKDRFCRTCSTRKRRTQVSRLLDLTRDHDRVRMLTLTLAHDERPLRVQLERLYQCYRRLRQRHRWIEHVNAAAAACELHVGDDGKWHVHLHVLWVGDYWRQQDISNEWLAVTGDSRIVDVRMMPTGSAVHYAAKYLAKAIPAEVAQNEKHLIEAIAAMKGKRLLIVSGDWVGKLREDMPDDPAEAEKLLAKHKLWVPIGSFHSIYARAMNGDTYAREILDQLTRPRGRFRPPDRPTRPEVPRMGNAIVFQAPR